MKSSRMKFCSMQSNKLEQFPLVATGTTGSLLFKKTSLILSRKISSGPLGDDQTVGTTISTKNICGVIFFRDPLSAHPHHADIEDLGRLCDVYQIPFATNPKIAKRFLTISCRGKRNASSSLTTCLRFTSRDRAESSRQVDQRSLRQTIQSD
jgi:methylglyoxal synthase